MAKIVGGGGGGKPSLAMGGGTDPTKIQDALARGLELVKEMFKKPEKLSNQDKLKKYIKNRHRI